VTRGQAGALALAVVLAVLVVAVTSTPVLGLGPLVVIGLPAGLMAWATARHGDPYDVTHHYRG